MKKFLALLLVMTTALLAVGCGKPDGVGAPYLSGFKAKDYVQLGDYKSLTVTVPSFPVTDDDVNQYIDYIKQYNYQEVEITDRAAELGDTVDIAFVGRIDGEEFEGGASESYLLDLGSGQFIAGFEDGVVGMMPEEEKDLELKFPDDYAVEDLAGKDVVFTVTLHKIIEYVEPELTDDFVKTLDMGVNTVAELKAQIREELEAEAAAQYDQYVGSAIEEQLEAICTFSPMPTAYVDRMVKILVDEIQQSAESYGMEPAVIAQYFFGIDSENYAEGVKEYCEGIAKMYVMFGAIAEENNITVTDEEIDAALKEELDSYGNPYSIEEYKSILGDMESYREYVLLNKVMDFLKENITINEEVQ